MALRSERRYDEIPVRCRGGRPKTTTYIPQFRSPRSEWDAFVGGVADVVRLAPQPDGASSKELAQSAARHMAPMTCLLAHALLIRLEREAGGGGVQWALLEQHAALARYALIMLQAAHGDAREPRVRLLLAGVAAGRVRSRCDVAAVARDVDLSVRCLSRLVYRETGASVQRHIQCRRLLHAAHLLSQTFLSIDKIAALAGYGGESRLDRCFRSVLGVLPIDLRRYRLREACRGHLRRQDDALFASWVTHRLPVLVARSTSGGSARCGMSLPVAVTESTPSGNAVKRRRGERGLGAQRPLTLDLTARLADETVAVTRLHSPPAN